MTVRNGLTLAYVVAFLNATLQLLVSFGLSLTHEQDLALTGFMNVSVMLAARVLHLPERTPDGGTVAVRHVPVMTTTSPDGTSTDTHVQVGGDG